MKTAPVVTAQQSIGLANPFRASYSGLSRTVTRDSTLSRLLDKTFDSLAISRRVELPRPAAASSAGRQNFPGPHGTPRASGDCRRRQDPGVRGRSDQGFRTAPSCDAAHVADRRPPCPRAMHAVRPPLPEFRINLAPALAGRNPFAHPNHARARFAPTPIPHSRRAKPCVAAGAARPCAPKRVQWPTKC